MIASDEKCGFQMANSQTVLDDVFKYVRSLNLKAGESNFSQSREYMQNFKIKREVTNYKCETNLRK